VSQHIVPALCKLHTLKVEVGALRG
jgi:hypothetical protein